MPAMRKSQKEVNESVSTLQGWFVGYTDDELVDVVGNYCQSANIRDEIISHLGRLDVGNCGMYDYELAERIEEAIYKIRYGVFWRLVPPGKYLLDRKSAFNMRAIVAHQPIPFPDWRAVEQLRAADASPREGSEN